MSDAPQEQEEWEEISLGQFIWEKTRWLASALFFPFFPTSFPKLGVFFATWWLIQPAATMLFPRAEKVLEEEGLRPEIVQELAPGKKVYIRTDNFWGKTHALFDRNPIKIPFQYWAEIRNESSAGAYTLPSVFGRVPSSICGVYMKSIVFPAKVDYQKSLLHEIRHCSKDNEGFFDFFSSNVLAEGDADYHAIEVLARERKNPDLKRYYFSEKSRWGFLDQDHDTALYLDAKFRQVALPSRKEMNEATDYLNNLVKTVGKGGVLSIKESCNGKGASEVCKFSINGKEMSQVTLRRIQLFAQTPNPSYQKPKPQTFKPVS
jgi:hypothetical protein